MKIRFCALFATCFLLLANCATTTPGMKAYQARDYAAALPLLTAEAKKGNTDSAYRLAELYTRKNSSTKDFDKALYWYTQAANKGHIRSQVIVGHAHRIGRLIDRDAMKAASYYLRAAKQNNKEAQYQLGRLYLEGNGVPQSNGDALSWLEKAAEHIPAERFYYYVPPIKDGAAGHVASSSGAPAKAGHPAARALLVKLYSGASGIPKDVEKVKKYTANNTMGGFFGLSSYTPFPQQYSQADIDGLFNNQTSRAFDQAHGNQIEFTATNGKTYLWYPGNRTVVQGEWKIRELAEICFRYSPGTYNPVTKQPGGLFNCQPIEIWLSHIKERHTGDVFGLASKSAVPHILTRFEKITLSGH